MQGLIVLNTPEPQPKKIPSSLSKTQKILAKFFYPKNQGMENFQPPKGFEQIVCYSQQLSGVSIYGW